MENTTAKQRLSADINAVLRDAEELLRQAGQATGEQANELRSRAYAAIVRAKESLYQAEQRAVEQTKAAAHATDAWVNQHPWTAVGIAAGLAFLVGLAVNRR
jgi:ElaB/YqjD/DUF883 family membrane-anchored ribosome-binding protein